jgi:hypothetical protein
MATQSIQGLFGGMASPEEMQRQMIEQRAAKFAELTQNQQLSSMGYKGGANLGQGLASAFGVDIQDPTIKKATMLRQLASQYNTNTAKGLRDMAAALQATDPESAFQLTQRAMAMDMEAQKARKEEAEITLKGAQTSKTSFETQELSDKQAGKNARVQLLRDAGLGESEAMGIASNDTAFSKYIETKKVPVPSDYAVQAQKLGFTAKPYLSDYTPDQVKKMEEGVVANKKAIAKAGAMNLDIGTIFDKARAAGDAKAQSEAWGKAGDTYKSQVALTGKLDRVVADLPATFTGSFANGSLQIAKVAAGLGIPVDTKRITNTEYLNSVTSELVRTIARDFPGSQSNAELQQLLLSKPSSPQQWQTILRLLQDVQRQTKAGTITYEKIAKLPQEERFKVDYNLENGQIQKKLARSDDLTARVRAGTASVNEAQELKKLRSELQ